MIFGGHQIMLMIIVQSFDVIPLGGFVLSAHIVTSLIGLLDVMMDMALKVSAPILCILFLQQIAMGFIARTLPQMNILSIGFAIRIFVGSLVVLLVVGADADVFVMTMRKTLQNLNALILR